MPLLYGTGGERNGNQYGTLSFVLFAGTHGIVENPAELFLQRFRLSCEIRIHAIPRKHITAGAGGMRCAL